MTRQGITEIDFKQIKKNNNFFHHLVHRLSACHLCLPPNHPHMLTVRMHSIRLVHNPGMTFMFWQNFFSESLGIVVKFTRLLSYQVTYEMCPSLCVIGGSPVCGFTAFISLSSNLVCNMLLFHVGLGSETMQGDGKIIVHVNYIFPILYILQQGGNHFMGSTNYPWCLSCSQPEYSYQL